MNSHFPYTYVCRMILTIHSAFYLITGLSNQDAVCLLWGILSRRSFLYIRATPCGICGEESRTLQFLSECVLFPPVSVIPPILHSPASFSSKHRPSLSAFAKQCFSRNHRALNGIKLPPLPALLSALGLPDGRSAPLGAVRACPFRCNEPLPLALFPHFGISLVFSTQPENSDFHRYLF